MKQILVVIFYFFTLQSVFAARPAGLVIRSEFVSALHFSAESVRLIEYHSGTSTASSPLRYPRYRLVINGRDLNARDTSGKQIPDKNMIITIPLGFLDEDVQAEQGQEAFAALRVYQKMMEPGQVLELREGLTKAVVALDGVNDRIVFVKRTRGLAIPVISTATPIRELTKPLAPGLGTVSVVLAPELVMVGPSSETNQDLQTLLQEQLTIARQQPQAVLDEARTTAAHQYLETVAADIASPAVAPVVATKSAAELAAEFDPLIPGDEIDRNQRGNARLQAGHFVGDPAPAAAPVVPPKPFTQRYLVLRRNPINPPVSPQEFPIRKGEEHEWRLAAQARVRDAFAFTCVNSLIK